MSDSYPFAPKKVVVSNGIGRFHVYRAAQAAEKIGCLDRFVTSFAVTEDWQHRLLAAKNTKVILGSRLVTKARSRSYEVIPAFKVASLILPELLLSMRTYMPSQWGNISQRAFDLFSSASKPFISGCDCFHVRSGFGGIALEAAKDQASLVVVDHSIAAPDYLLLVDEKERDRWIPLHLQPKCRQQNTGVWERVNFDIQNADVILVNSSFVREQLISFSRVEPTKIEVIPMGVNTSIFKPARTKCGISESFTILFVGTLSLRKGVLYLLEAFRRLRLPKAQLTLVGKMGDVVGPLGSYEGLFNYVHHMPQHLLVAEYQKASVFVFPSLAEGSALVTYEAMASGLPVITTVESGSVVRDGIDGFIVSSGDVDQLAERIQHFYDNRDKICEMGKAASEYVTGNFSWSAYEAKVQDLYRRRLGGPSVEARNDLRLSSSASTAQSALQLRNQLQPF